MEKLRWWQADGGEFHKINEAAEEINDLQFETADIRRKIRRLFELDRDQGKTLEEIKISIEVLIETLAVAGLLNPNTFMDRVEHEIAERRKPPPPATKAAGPYRSGGAAQQKKPERKVLCLECEKEVPVSYTHVTAHGEICDACYVPEALREATPEL